ncbi:Ankyrin repeat and zinc finger domain-containing protein 1 [Perkinsus chesapeaki]|uniref:Ankyrin repeat and zinc finger domain-containing protein 1 n=1 Tax=Perkinsus chesapeaki TaxID=330153 RepID=A0A7J6N2A4_PERCH|nr:Ankyrin repeat and zinc finger domain-containing protein 1 [Perkinsus chesapeaki]
MFGFNPSIGLSKYRPGGSSPILGLQAAPNGRVLSVITRGGREAQFYAAGYQQQQAPMYRLRTAASMLGSTLQEGNSKQSGSDLDSGDESMTFTGLHAWSGDSTRVFLQLSTRHLVAVFRVRFGDDGFKKGADYDYDEADTDYDDEGGTKRHVRSHQLRQLPCHIELECTLSVPTEKFSLLPGAGNRLFIVSSPTEVSSSSMILLLDTDNYRQRAPKVDLSVLKRGPGAILAFEECRCLSQIADSFIAGHPDSGLRNRVVATSASGGPSGVIAVSVVIEGTSEVWLLRDRPVEGKGGCGLGRVLSVSGSCSCVALSGDCLAVALTGGVVDLYNIQDPQDTLELAHLCRIKSSDLLSTTEELPPKLPVSGLTWAGDRVLLVHTGVGLGAVSVDGARLGCFTHGCGPVKFAAGSTSYLWACVVTFNEPEIAKFPAVVEHPSMLTGYGDDVSCPSVPLLASHERMLLPKASSSTWKAVHYPHMYMRTNWPPRVFAGRPGHWIMVCGEFGFVVYSYLRDKWRLFGDVAHEGLVGRVRAACSLGQYGVTLNSSGLLVVWDMGARLDYYTAKLASVEAADAAEVKAMATSEDFQVVLATLTEATSYRYNGPGDFTVGKSVRLDALPSPLREVQLFRDDSGGMVLLALLRNGEVFREQDSGSMKFVRVCGGVRRIFVFEPTERNQKSQLEISKSSSTDAPATGGSEEDASSSISPLTYRGFGGPFMIPQTASSVGESRQGKTGVGQSTSDETSDESQSVVMTGYRSVHPLPAPSLSLPIASRNQTNEEASSSSPRFDLPISGHEDTANAAELFTPSHVKVVNYSKSSKDSTTLGKVEVPPDEKCPFCKDVCTVDLATSYYDNSPRAVSELASVLDRAQVWMEDQAGLSLWINGSFFATRIPIDSPSAAVLCVYPSQASFRVVLPKQSWSLVTAPLYHTLLHRLCSAPGNRLLRTAYNVSCTVYSAKEFRVVLELLLHESIDACVPIFLRLDKLGVTDVNAVHHHSPVNMRLRTLRNALHLVGHFGPSGVDYLVAALRKTEPHVSFRHVLGMMDEGGSERVAPELFRSALKAGRLYQAAALLLLVQYSAGPETARKDYALPLLKAALDAGEKSLAEQCIRFYSAMGTDRPPEVVSCVREYCIKLVVDCKWVDLLNCFGADGTAREFLEGVPEPTVVQFNSVVRSFRALMICDREPGETKDNVGIVQIAADEGSDDTSTEGGGSPSDNAGLHVSRQLFLLFLSIGWSRRVLAMCVASRDPRSLAFAMGRDPMVKEMCAAEGSDECRSLLHGALSSV